LLKFSDLAVALPLLFSSSALTVNHYRNHPFWDSFLSFLSGNQLSLGVFELLSFFSLP